MTANSAPLIEGKTKIVYPFGQDTVRIVSKDDITAGDGAKRDIIPEKGVLANETTCNVFTLLKRRGVPVAFIEQDGANSFIAAQCKMLPYEVVVRREAYGSFLKRNPDVQKGQVFPSLIVEFFLKTNNRQWKSYPLPCDDPLMVLNSESGLIQLYEPSKPLEKPFLVLRENEVFSSPNEAMLFAPMAGLSTETFTILEEAWREQGIRLVDFKLEFGITSSEQLLLADVIDNDSWRIIEEDSHLDKQEYRDGKALSKVAEKYRRVANLTALFVL